MNTTLSKKTFDNSNYLGVKKRRSKKIPALRTHAHTMQGFIEECDRLARSLGSIRPVTAWARDKYAKTMYENLSDERMLLRAWESLKGEAAGIDGIKLDDVPRYAVYRIWCNACRLFGEKAPPFNRTIFPTTDNLNLYVIGCMCDPEHRYKTKRIEFDRKDNGNDEPSEDYLSNARTTLEQLKQMRPGYFALLSDENRIARIHEMERCFSDGTHVATVMMRLQFPGAHSDKEAEEASRALLYDTGMGKAPIEQIMNVFIAGIGGLLELGHLNQAKSFIAGTTPLTHVQEYVKGEEKPIRRSLHFVAMRWIRDTILRPKRDSGIGYRPGPLRKVEIPKPDGGTRTLSLPTAVERVTAKSALMAAQPVMEEVFLPNSVGCRYDRDRFDAFVAMQNYYPGSAGKFILTADIKKAFDNVPHDIMLETLAKYTPNRDMNELYIRTVRRPGFESGLGIAQGDPLSPFFLNVLLHEHLDVPLRSLMKERNLLYTRYVDDLSLLGLASHEEASAFIEKIQALLRPIGLELHTEAPKTQVVDLAQSTAECYTNTNKSGLGEIDRYLGLGLRGRQDGELEFFLPSSWPERLRIMYLNAEETIRRNGYAGSKGAHTHILHATESWIQAFAPALSAEPRDETINQIIAICHLSARHTGNVDVGMLGRTWNKAQDLWKRKCGEG